MLLRIRKGTSACIGFLLVGSLLLAGCGGGPEAHSVNGFGMVSNRQAGVVGASAPSATPARLITSRPSVIGGGSVRVVVELSGPAPAGGARLLLFSSNPAVHIPLSVEIPSGETSANVEVATAEVTETTPILITASGGVSAVSANLIVAPAIASPFSVSLNPTTVTIQQGKSGSSKVATKISSGYNHSLQLSTSNLPVSVNASLNPAVIPAPGSGASKLILDVQTSAHTGSYPITVTASDGKNRSSEKLTLKVISGSTNPNATFKGCWYKSGGHRYQAVDVMVANPGAYPFNAVLYSGTSCNPNNFADQIGFGQLINFGGFGYTFWFSDFRDQTNMSALWYVGDENSKCVDYAVAPDC